MKGTKEQQQQQQQHDEVDTQTSNKSVEEDSVKHGQGDPRTQENRRKVLQFIPPKVQKEYREICFAKWCGYILPAIQLGPMDVHSTHVLKDYYDMVYRVCR